MVLIQKYYKRFLGKTLLQKGYSPNPFPKTLNELWSRNAVRKQSFAINDVPQNVL